MSGRGLSFATASGGKAMTNRAKRALAEGRVLLGAATHTTVDPGIIWAIAAGGADFVFIDMEHTALGIRDVSELVLAAHSSEVTPLVRVPTIGQEWIGRVLDTGCQSILIPGIRTVEELDSVIEACYFHPVGRRGLGLYGNATSGFRAVTDVKSLADTLNRNLLIGILIETRDALGCLPHLLRPEVGFVLVGTQDLAQDFGRLGETECAEVVDALTAVRDACSAHHVPYAVNARSLSAISAAVAEGAAMIIYGGVLGFVRESVGLASQELGRRLSFFQDGDGVDE